MIYEQNKNCKEGIDIIKRKQILELRMQEWFNIKTICGKPTANIICNDERPKAFPLRSRTKEKSSLLPLLFSVVLEVLPHTIRQGK